MNARGLVDPSFVSELNGMTGLIWHVFEGDAYRYGFNNARYILIIRMAPTGWAWTCYDVKTDRLLNFGTCGALHAAASECKKLYNFLKD